MSRLNIIGIDLAKTNFYLFSLSPEGSLVEGLSSLVKS
jgi:hypothetical protein